VKLRSEFRQIIGVYRHWRACFLRLIEAAEHHINISEPWVKLEFATLARGNYRACATSQVQPRRRGELVRTAHVEPNTSQRQAQHQVA
jgi:hypothetical protein